MIKRLAGFFLSIAILISFTSCGSVFQFIGNDFQRHQLNLKTPSIPKDNPNGDVRIVEISTGDYLTAGLRSDGTVVVTGLNSAFHNLSDWSNIVAISVGTYHIVGLRSDGTTIAANFSNYDSVNKACDISNWTDIVAISAGQFHTVGLCSDGTVKAVGSLDEACDVDEWRDIVAISAGANHTLGLHRNGTAVAAGRDEIKACQVGGWNNIVAISTSSFDSVGLQFYEDGNMGVEWEGYSIGQDTGIMKWIFEDIVSVSAGGSHTVGLRSNGTVVAIGENTDGECNVDDWTDIIAISAGFSHTVGLRSNGTVVATGANTCGQCSVSDWPNKGSAHCAVDFLGMSIKDIIAIFGQDYIFPDEYYAGSLYFYYDHLPFLFLFNPNSDVPSKEDVIVGVLTFYDGMIIPELSSDITALEFQERFGNVEYDSDFLDYRAILTWNGYWIILQWDNLDEPTKMALVKRDS